MYRIGKTNEEEDFRLDFLDEMSRTVEERVNLGSPPARIYFDDIMEQGHHFDPLFRLNQSEFVCYK
jgi:hypothetical protein